MGKTSLLQGIAVSNILVGIIILSVLQNDTGAIIFGSFIALSVVAFGVACFTTLGGKG